MKKRLYLIKSEINLDMLMIMRGMYMLLCIGMGGPSM